jgi:hypothetical protein
VNQRLHQRHRPHDSEASSRRPRQIINRNNLLTSVVRTTICPAPSSLDCLPARMGIGRTLSKSLITLRLAIRVNMRSDPMPARAGSWQGDTFTPPPQRSVFEPRQQTQQATPPSGQTASPRNVFAPRSSAPFGSSGEPFESSRPRRTQPRDHAADDAVYLRDLERQPRDWKDKSADVIRALNSVFGSNPKALTPTLRERGIAETQQRIERQLGRGPVSGADRCVTESAGISTGRSGRERD